MNIGTNIEIETKDGQVFHSYADCASAYVVNAVKVIAQWHRNEGREPVRYRLARGGEYIGGFVEVPHD